MKHYLDLTEREANVLTLALTTKIHERQSFLQEFKNVLDHDSLEQEKFKISTCAKIAEFIANIDSKIQIREQ